MKSERDEYREKIARAVSDAIDVSSGEPTGQPITDTDYEIADVVLPFLADAWDAGKGAGGIWAANASESLMLRKLPPRMPDNPFREVSDD